MKQRKYSGRAVRALLVIVGASVLLLGNTGCAKVRYKLMSDRQLNWYNEEPHTLEVRIFQLRNKTDFESAGNWKKLCSEQVDRGLFLGDPIVERTVYPDMTIKKKIRKEKGAKFLGIVACYYDPSGYPPRTRAVIPLPRRFLGMGRRARYTVHLGSNQIEQITRRGLFGREKPLTKQEIDIQGEDLDWKTRYEEGFQSDVNDGVKKQKDDAIDRGMDSLYP